MKQYIDKDALMEEIERLIDKGKYHEEYDCAYRDGNNSALYALKEIIDTLEVKETHDIWHDVTEKPELGQPLLIVMNGTYKDFRRRYRIGCYSKKANDIPTWVIDGCYSDSFISKWCYISDILQHTLEVKEMDLELNSFDATVCKIGSTYLKEMDKDAIAKALEPYKNGDKVKVIIKSQKEE